MRKRSKSSHETIMRRLQPAPFVPLLFALLCVGSSAPALGAPPALPPPAPPQPQPAATSGAQPAANAAAAMDKADELYRQGNEAYKQNRLKDAYQFYKDAWNLKKSYDIAGNLGAVELVINMPRDAADHLLHSLRQFPANGKPEARDKTRQRLEEALKQIGTLSIKVNINGAEVFIDGKSIGQAPFDREIFVDAGARKIEARIEGYNPGTQQINVAKGSTQEVSIQLTKFEAPVPIAIKPKRPSWIFPVLVAGGAVSAAALGTGIGLLVAGSSKADDADAMLGSLQSKYGAAPCAPPNAVQPQCSELKALRTDHDTFHNVGVGTMVVGGMALAATVGTALYVYKFRAKSEKNEPGPVALPLAGPHGAGVLIHAHF